MIRGLLRRLRRDDRGIALPVVVGLGLVMLILVGSSMSTVAGGVQKTNTDEDGAAALSAAYAGVEEYQSRLANSRANWLLGSNMSRYPPGRSIAATVARVIGRLLTQ